MQAIFPHPKSKHPGNCSVSCGGCVEKLAELFTTEKNKKHFAMKNQARVTGPPAGEAYSISSAQDVAEGAGVGRRQFGDGRSACPLPARSVNHRVSDIINLTSLT
jgi:NAD(P)H-nitrite reductase large subunit